MSLCCLTGRKELDKQKLLKVEVNPDLFAIGIDVQDAVQGSKEEGSLWQDDFIVLEGTETVKLSLKVAKISGPYSCLQVRIGRTYNSTCHRSTAGQFDGIMQSLWEQKYWRKVLPGLAVCSEASHLRRWFSSTRWFWGAFVARSSLKTWQATSCKPGIHSSWLAWQANLVEQMSAKATCQLRILQLGPTRQQNAQQTLWYLF